MLTEPFVVTLPERHFAAAERRRSILADLAGEPFIFVPRRVEPSFYDRCIALCQSYGFSPNIVEEGTGPTAICGMVATGLGITLSPASTSRPPGRIVFRHLSPPSLDLELAVATRREEPSAALRGLLNTIDNVTGRPSHACSAPFRHRGSNTSSTACLSGSSSRL